ncbi:MAG: hypothetical protein H0T83_06515 [Chthoniobacterales bacterium]|nr:hypothetical protein [Chthoniobacterales bacterium]
MNTVLNSLPSNYVKLDHGNGQASTYFHMKKKFWRKSPSSFSHPAPPG